MARAVRDSWGVRWVETARGWCIQDGLDDQTDVEGIAWTELIAEYGPVEDVA